MKEFGTRLSGEERMRKLLTAAIISIAFIGGTAQAAGTVSYKDAKVVGNVSKLDELNDMGDIDNYESINTQAVRAGNRDPVSLIPLSLL
mgnify:CR=1 FL=1